MSAGEILFASYVVVGILIILCAAYAYEDALIPAIAIAPMWPLFLPFFLLDEYRFHKKRKCK